MAASAYPTLKTIPGVTFAILANAYDAFVTDETLTPTEGQEVLDFTVPYDDPVGLQIANEQQIGFNSSIFRVKLNDEGWDSSGLQTRQVHCEALFYDLGDMDAILVPATTSATIAITTILAGTGWVAGSVAAVSGGTFAVTERANPLSCLRALPGTFGGELWFDNVHQTVNLSSIRGDQSGNVTYGHGLNLAGARRIIDTTAMITRVRPVGASGVDISTVNGGIPYLDDTSWYTGQGLTPPPPKAVVVTTNQITDPVALLQWGRAQLAALAKPKITYTNDPTTVVGVAFPGLGDKVRVFDSDLGLNLFTRVNKRVLYPLEPWRSTVTLNSALYTLTDALIGTIGTPATPAGSQAGMGPAAPTGVSITSAQASDITGFTYTYATISWTPVTTNQDGTPMVDFGSYYVEYQIDGGSWIPVGNTTRTSVQTAPFRAQASITARVQAVDTGGNGSGFGTSTVTAVKDTAAPPKPSLPVLSSHLPLALEVTWNGLDYLGGIQPSDFARVEVHLGTISGFSPTVTGATPTLFDNISSPSGGVAVATKLTQGVTYWVGLRAVDRSGNLSAMSTPVSGVASLIPAGSHVALSVVDADIGSLNVGKLVAGTITADVTISSRIKTADSGARVELNSTGLKAFNAAGTQTVGVNSDGSASFTGTVTGGLIQTASSGSRVTLDAAGLGPDRINWYAGSGLAGEAPMVLYNSYSGGMYRSYFRSSVDSVRTSASYIQLSSSTGVSDGALLRLQANSNGNSVVDGGTIQIVAGIIEVDGKLQVGSGQPAGTNYAEAHRSTGSGTYPATPAWGKFVYTDCTNHCDDGNIFNGVTPGAHINVSGFYLISFTCTFTVLTSGHLRLTLVGSGAVVADSYFVGSPATVSVGVQLSAGDVVEAWLLITNASTVPANSSDTPCIIRVCQVA